MLYRTRMQKYIKFPKFAGNYIFGFHLMEALHQTLGKVGNKGNKGKSRKKKRKMGRRERRRKKLLEGKERESDRKG